MLFKPFWRACISRGSTGSGPPTGAKCSCLCSNRCQFMWCHHSQGICIVHQLQLKVLVTGYCKALQGLGQKYPMDCLPSTAVFEGGPLFPSELWLLITCKRASVGVGFTLWNSLPSKMWQVSLPSNFCHWLKLCLFQQSFATVLWVAKNGLIPLWSDLVVNCWWCLNCF